MTRLHKFLTVAFFTFASRVLGFSRDILLAYSLGAGLLSDIFFVAFKLPNLFRRLFAEGALQSAFIPIFTSIESSDSNRDTQMRFAREVFGLLTICLIILVIILEIFMPYVLIAMAPGFYAKADSFQLAVNLSRITLPYILFVSLAAFGTGVLNSYNRFSASSIMPMMLNVGIIFSIALGYYLSSDNIVYWAAVGVFIGGVAQLIFILLALKNAGWVIKPILNIYYLIKNLSSYSLSFLKRVVPVFLGAGIYQVNILVDIIAASWLPYGAVSYLFYADRLVQLPLAVIGIAIATVLLPDFSKMSSNKEISRILNEAIVFTLSLAMPALVGLIIFGEEIVYIFFQYGSFTESNTLLTYYAIVAYAIGMPFAAISKIAMSVFYAKGDTSTPVKVLGIVLLFSIILVFALSYYIGHIGIAIASSISIGLNCLCLLFLLKRRNIFTFTKRTLKNLALLSIVILVFILILYGAKYFILTTEEVKFIFIVKLLSIIIASATLWVLVLFYFKNFFIRGLNHSE